MDLDGKKFIDFVLQESTQYDIIHVHSLYKIVPLIRKKNKNKFIILHYHGSELRNGVSNMSLKKVILRAENNSNLILVSTPDLIKYSPRTIYLNNPNDREHFKPVRYRQSNNIYLTMKTNNLDFGLLKNYLKSNNLEFILNS
jgi:hypothetical protein